MKKSTRDILKVICQLLAVIVEQEREQGNESLSRQLDALRAALATLITSVIH